MKEFLLDTDDEYDENYTTQANFNNTRNKQFIRLGGGGLGSKIDPAKAKIAYGKSNSHLWQLKDKKSQIYKRNMRSLQDNISASSVFKNLKYFQYYNKKKSLPLQLPCTSSKNVVKVEKGIQKEANNSMTHRLSVKSDKCSRLLQDKSHFQQLNMEAFGDQTTKPLKIKTIQPPSVTNQENFKFAKNFQAKKKVLQNSIFSLIQKKNKSLQEQRKRKELQMRIKLRKLVSKCNYQERVRSMQQALKARSKPTTNTASPKLISNLPSQPSYSEVTGSLTPANTGSSIQHQKLEVPQQFKRQMQQMFFTQIHKKSSQFKQKEVEKANSYKRPRVMKKFDINLQKIQNVNHHQRLTQSQNKFQQGAIGPFSCNYPEFHRDNDFCLAQKLDGLESDDHNTYSKNSHLIAKFS